MAILEDYQRRRVGDHMTDTGITNVDQCQKALEEIAVTEWGAVCKAFEKVVLETIMPECMEECPVDTGVLKASIPLCSGVESNSLACTATIGAGGAAADYAVRQHEDLTLHHPAMTRGPGTTHSRDVVMSKFASFVPSPAGQYGKAKFIEDPVMRNAPKMAQMIASKLKWRGGSR